MLAWIKACWPKIKGGLELISGSLGSANVVQLGQELFCATRSNEISKDAIPQPPAPVVSPLDAEPERWNFPVQRGGVWACKPYTELVALWEPWRGRCLAINLTVSTFSRLALILSYCIPSSVLTMVRNASLVPRARRL
jgi:hypothetical protein